MSSATFLTFKCFLCVQDHKNQRRDARYTPIELTPHLKEHLRYTPYRCTVCGPCVQTPTEDLMKTHCETMHTAEEKAEVKKTMNKELEVLVQYYRRMSVMGHPGITFAPNFDDNCRTTEKPAASKKTTKRRDITPTTPLTATPIEEGAKSSTTTTGPIRKRVRWSSNADEICGQQHDETASQTSVVTDEHDDGSWIMEDDAMKGGAEVFSPEGSVVFGSSAACGVADEDACLNCNDNEEQGALLETAADTHTQEGHPLEGLDSSAASDPTDKRRRWSNADATCEQVNDESAPHTYDDTAEDDDVDAMDVDGCSSPEGSFVFGSAAACSVADRDSFLNCNGKEKEDEALQEIPVDTQEQKANEVVEVFGLSSKPDGDESTANGHWMSPPKEEISEVVIKPEIYEPPSENTTSDSQPPANHKSKSKAKSSMSIPPIYRPSIAQRVELRRKAKLLSRIVPAGFAKGSRLSTSTSWVTTQDTCESSDHPKTLVCRLCVIEVSGGAEGAFNHVLLQHLVSGVADRGQYVKSVLKEPGMIGALYRKCFLGGNPEAMERLTKKFDTLCKVESGPFDGYSLALTNIGTAIHEHSSIQLDKYTQAATCAQCSHNKVIVPTPIALRLHIIEHHQNKPYFWCRLCEREGVQKPGKDYCFKTNDRLVGPRQAEMAMRKRHKSTDLHNVACVVTECNSVLQEKLQRCFPNSGVFFTKESAFGLLGEGAGATAATSDHWALL